MIVTIFYDVEGDYARRGATPNEVDCVERILEIERGLRIRSTYNVVARFAMDAPDVVTAIRAGGNEIASHSYDHSVLTGLDGAALDENLRRTRHAFADLGVRVRGHRSPQSDWDGRVLGALLAGGYEWNAENGAEPYPYRIRQHGDRTVWRFPVAGDDWRYESGDVPPRQMLGVLQGRVLAARGRRKYLAMGFHPWVEAAPGRLAVLEEFFQWLVEQDDVEIMPFEDVLRLMNEPTPPGRAVAHG